MWSEDCSQLWRNFVRYSVEEKVGEEGRTPSWEERSCIFVDGGCGAETGERLGLRLGVFFCVQDVCAHPKLCLSVQLDSQLFCIRD